MPDDAAAAMIADRRQLVDGAFETVEHMGLPGGHHFEGQIIIVPADLTPGHGALRFTGRAACPAILQWWPDGAGFSRSVTQPASRGSRPPPPDRVPRISSHGSPAAGPSPAP